ncbi:MAG: hypothetical protein NVS1B7_7850 [Candidatus Saccharimonadales bacterium]
MVQFYDSGDELMQPLTTYIAAGVVKGESCIIIATPLHRQMLQDRLANAHIDYLVAQRQGQLIFLDAAEALETFMVNSMPDSNRFFEVVGGLIDQAASHGNPTRAYGEMVALLWREGNPKAVMALERLWEELLKIYSFSLFCAYPTLHFLTNVEEKRQISELHAVHCEGKVPTSW